MPESLKQAAEDVSAKTHISTSVICRVGLIHMLQEFKKTGTIAVIEYHDGA